MSKTDTHVLSFCTRETRMTQQSLGFLVVLTGIFAFYSGFYAVSTTFGNTVIAVPVALVYATAIMAFDRELVSFTSEDKRALLLRLPIAVLIGLVISLPLELRLMDKRIDAQIRQLVEARNQTLVTEIGQIEERIAGNRSALQQELDVLDDQLRKLAGSMEREERDRFGVGPRYRELRAQYERLLAQRDRIKDELAAVAKTSAEETRIQQIRGQLDAEYKDSRRDLLGRFEALGKVEEQSASAAVLSWTLRLFFVFLELFPVGIKFFLPYNEYQAYLNARRCINVQKAHCYGSWAMSEIEKDPWGSLKRPEFSDDLEHAIEDSSRNVGPGPGQAGSPSPNVKVPKP